MKGIRTQVSLLIANGHSGAATYPLGKVWLESEIVAKRIDKHLADTAMLTNMAVSAVLSETAGKEFNDRIKDLTDGW